MLGWGKPKGLNRSSIIYACAARWHNIDKAKELLGYQPVVGRDEGIKLAVEVCLERYTAVIARTDLWMSSRLI